MGTSFSRLLPDQLSCRNVRIHNKLNLISIKTKLLSDQYQGISTQLTECRNTITQLTQCISALDKDSKLNLHAIDILDSKVSSLTEQVIDSNQDNSTLTNKVDVLTDQMAQLRTATTKLTDNYHHLSDNQPNLSEYVRIQALLSPIDVDQIVTEFITESDNNLKYVPDTVESPLYQCIAKLCVKIITIYLTRSSKLNLS